MPSDIIMYLFPEASNVHIVSPDCLSSTVTTGFSFSCVAQYSSTVFAAIPKEPAFISSLTADSSFIERVFPSRANSGCVNSPPSISPTRRRRSSPPTLALATSISPTNTLLCRSPSTFTPLAAISLYLSSLSSFADSSLFSLNSLSCELSIRQRSSPTAAISSAEVIRASSVSLSLSATAEFISSSIFPILQQVDAFFVGTSAAPTSPLSTIRFTMISLRLSLGHLSRLGHRPQ